MPRRNQHVPSSSSSSRDPIVTRRTVRIIARASSSQPNIVRPPNQRARSIRSDEPLSVSSASSDDTLSSDSTLSSEDTLTSESELSSIAEPISLEHEDYAPEREEIFHVRRGEQVAGACTHCGFLLGSGTQVEYRSREGGSIRREQRHMECIRLGVPFYFPSHELISFSDGGFTPAERQTFIGFFRAQLRPVPRASRGRSAASYVASRELFTEFFGHANEPPRRGLSAEMLTSFPRVQFVATEEEEVCVICLDSFKSGQSLVRLPCFHQFHADCIFEWLNCSKLCPIDKLNLENLVGMMTLKNRRNTKF